MRDEVRALAELMPPDSIPRGYRDIGQILISGEPILIPARHHAPELNTELIAALSDRQRSIIHCIYTRHHDGFVRQRHLGAVIGLAEHWVAPYVIQLLGEYVREIAKAMVDRLADMDPQVYASFGRENQGFIRLTQQRIVSYWACYYRDERLYDQPAFVAMRALGFWPAPVGRRLLPRPAV